ncbi:hypothetical protein ACOME3_000430 [Neoechinorhynchus agilis]
MESRNPLELESLGSKREPGEKDLEIESLENEFQKELSQYNNVRIELLSERKKLDNLRKIHSRDRRNFNVATKELEDARPLVKAISDVEKKADSAVSQAITELKEVEQKQDAYKEEINAYNKACAPLIYASMYPQLLDPQIDHSTIIYKIKTIYSKVDSIREKQAAKLVELEKDDNVFKKFTIMLKMLEANNLEMSARRNEARRRWFDGQNELNKLRKDVNRYRRKGFALSDAIESKNEYSAKVRKIIKETENENSQVEEKIRMVNEKLRIVKAKVKTREKTRLQLLKENTKLSEECRNCSVEMESVEFDANAKRRTIDTQFLELESAEKQRDKLRERLRFTDEKLRKLNCEVYNATTDIVLLEEIQAEIKSLMGENFDQNSKCDEYKRELISTKAKLQDELNKLSNSEREILKTCEQIGQGSLI